MSHTPKVVILMSTYNGELYIEEQLKSLFDQTYQNFELIIRDDGSNDHTIRIIQDYKEKLSKKQAEKIRVISNTEGENWGYIRSFWYLLKVSPEADFYMFCDQDDFWLPAKIERGVEMLKRESDGIPLLYTARFDYCSGSLEFQEHGIKYPYRITFDKVAFYTPAFGFTIMINNCLREIALSCSDLKNIPHDAWCLKIAAAMGNVVYDETITAKYRRHESTVTYASASRFELVKKWIENDLIKGNLEERYWFLKRFGEEYAEQISEKDRKFIRLFEDKADNKSVLCRIKRLFYRHRLRPTIGGELALRICFILGR